MGKKLLIVEDEFIVANNLQLILEHAGYTVCGIAATVDQARKILSQHDVDLVLLDIHLKGKLTGIDLARELRADNIAFVYISANADQQILEAAKATEPYGFIVKPYREKDVLITLDIADYRHKHSLESKLRQESVLALLLEKIPSEPVPWQERLLKMATAIQQYLPFDFLAVCMRSPEEPFVNGCSFLRIGFNEYQSLGAKELSTISGVPQNVLYDLFVDAPVHKTAVVYNGEDFEHHLTQHGLNKMYAKSFQLQCGLFFPIFIDEHHLFTFSFFSRKTNIYQSDHLALLVRLQSMLTAVVRGMPLIEKKKLYDDAYRGDNNGRQTSVSGFHQIVGNSSPLLHVLDLVSQVAPLDTSVLILGESGTGKERIADCLHHLSSRRGKPFVKVNCAALPLALIESELFGHEKGAFTGATERKVGKFELASGGTIFLDELGELPIEQQVKLLRVLQEREIERLGGKMPVKVDVRIIAATNRNLEKEVAAGRFRLDLYYRLNVFPILLPPLRERKDDIGLLANHFAAKFCEKIGKGFNGISESMLDALMTYHWPGNIRELENIMEQSVIMQQGSAALTLKRVLSYEPTNMEQRPVSSVSSLNDVRLLQQQTEKEYISSMLRKAGGRIRGKGGAAELLGQKPTTLESRMLKLGIRKEDFNK